MANIIAKYDENSDLLSVYREGSKIRREVDVGDMTVQFNSEEKVVGFEMMNASDFIILDNENIESTEFLKNIESANLNVKHTQNAIQIVSYLSSTVTKDSAMVSSQAPTAAPA